MKILSLRFKNLNSLQGEWVIDFTSPEYVSDGIFAITGPTGAGKSTILDAICLALYGKTPRLAKINQSTNEIMSRQTGECFAEVVFESQNGKFCCHWSQHRARLSADGNLISPKHEISDFESKKVLENKKNAVAKLIIEKTGMDFHQFTRSVLLAQGGFAEFLKASPDEKTPILEQITGTDIYSVISKKVFERQQEEKKKLDLIEASTEGIIILTPEQEEQINHDLLSKQASEKETSTKNQKNTLEIQWLNNISQLRTEIGSLEAQAKNLSENIESFKPQQEKLDRAEKASELEGKYVSVNSTRLQKNANESSLKKNKDRLPKLESLLSENEKQLKISEVKTLNYINEQKKVAPILKNVRSLDLKALEKFKAIEEDKKELKKVEEQLTKNRKQLKKYRKLLKSSEKELSKVNQYLSNNKADEALVTQLAAITDLIKNLQNDAMDIKSKEASIEKYAKQLKKNKKDEKAIIKKVTKQKEACEAVQKKVCSEQESLKKLLGDKLLKEYRIELKFLIKEIIYLEKIAGYEEDRKKLEDGKPCMLCGALEHPYAKGNSPQISDTEKQKEKLETLIEKAEAHEAIIKELQNEEKKLAKKLSDEEKKLVKATNSKENSEENLGRLTEELKVENDKLLKAKQNTIEKLNKLGVSEIPDNDLESLLPSLNKRLENWQKNQKNKVTIEEQLNKYTTEVEKLNSVISTLDETLNDKNKIISELSKEHELLLAERKELYGNKDPDEVEAKLEKQIASAHSAEKAARDTREAASKELGEVKALIKSLEERLQKNTIELEELEKSFKLSLAELGFSDEATFLECRMSVDDRNELAKKAQLLKEKQAEITSLKKDKETIIAIEVKKQLTQESLENLKILQNKYELELKAMAEEIGSLKQKLVDNKNAKEKLKGKQALIEGQKKEFQRWYILYKLIGSKDGKKYRNFAQGLTFETVINHANKELIKMTDRYLLIRDNDEPLELNVVDNYQAGEIRSTKNLSGGESFIVSLALALGLSKMASQKVRVDSLFLDEGFGSLDEESLDTALETLGNLQQNNKLIGVISHVSKLKERISTQLNVYPTKGGKSEISGPGVIRN